ncbi:hypothetical protein Ae406Ps2_2483 [Pseudonocardia sp. Ae406_Ps2]|nr:hypothetical protein Ae406Ps2_2483 [Pseudonocardia sp. Ae406_Ps2]OLM24055.1 hypothetical protein Ae706Ps2_2488 [Pseudonocardia sp. Ae706_Ps2]
MKSTACPGPDHEHVDGADGDDSRGSTTHEQ